MSNAHVNLFGWFVLFSQNNSFSDWLMNQRNMWFWNHMLVPVSLYSNSQADMELHVINCTLLIHYLIKKLTSDWLAHFHLWSSLWSSLWSNLWLASYMGQPYPNKGDECLSQECIIKWNINLWLVVYSCLFKYFYLQLSVIGVSSGCLVTVMEHYLWWNVCLFERQWSRLAVVMHWSFKLGNWLSHMALMCQTSLFFSFSSYSISLPSWAFLHLSINHFSVTYDIILDYWIRSRVFDSPIWDFSAFKGWTGVRTVQV